MTFSNCVYTLSPPFRSSDDMACRSSPLGRAQQSDVSLPLFPPIGEAPFFFFELACPFSAFLTVFELAYRRKVRRAGMHVTL